MTRKIVVIDDDPAVRGLCLRALAGRYQAEAYSDPEQAQASLNQADLVISDLEMPCGGGMRVLDDVLASGSPIPVLIITGLDPADALRRAASERCSELLPKPFGIQELIQAVDRCLVGRESS